MSHVPLPKFVAPSPAVTAGGADGGARVVGRVWLLAAAGSALVAAIVAAVLAYRSWSAPGAASGCDATGWFRCDDVLNSRWSRWWNLPVSGPAAVVYGAMTALLVVAACSSGDRTRRFAWGALLILAALVVGAACWFVGLQALVLRSFCRLCLTAHAGGVLAAVVVLVRAPAGWRFAPPRESRSALTPLATWGLVAGGCLGSILLVSGQYFSEPPVAEMTIVALPGDDSSVAPPTRDVVPSKTAPPVAAPSSAASPAASTTTPPANPSTTIAPDVVAPRETPAATRPPEPTIPVAKTTAVDPPRPLTEPTQPTVPAVPAQPRRELSLFGGQAKLDVDELPRAGSAAASHVVVKLFDYTCKHCRVLHKQLETLRPEYGDHLTIVYLPVPLSTECNPLIPKTHADHLGACGYTRLALAVWRLDRDAFAKLHHWLLADEERVPTLPAAREQAARLVGARQLAAAEQDPWIDAQIARGCELYKLAGAGSIPKLLYGRYVVSGQASTVERVREMLDKTFQVPRKAD